jgi:hypothetical protein
MVPDAPLPRARGRDRCGNLGPKNQLLVFASFASSRFIIGRMRRAVAVLFVLTISCGGDDGSDSPDGGGGGPADAAPVADAAPLLPDASLDPMTLAETGLYSDPTAETLAPGVFEYEVNYDLWADGATKRRFVYLPAGAAIDTSDMDFWHLPEGTRLWKEFTRDGVRIETRLLWKQGPTEDDWYSMSFAWNEAGTEAVAASIGVEDALGTEQDIPSATDCKTCHDRQPGFALGFGALQLDHADGDMNLAALVEQGRLSNPPAGSAAPIFPLPGGPVEQAALGYLHGNCGPCHNPNSDIFLDKRTLIVWHLDVDSLDTVQDTTIHQSTVDVPPRIPLFGTPVEITAVIEPGNRDASSAFHRMNLRDPAEDSVVPMPPLSTEVPDLEGGVAAVGAWIDLLGAN